MSGNHLHVHGAHDHALEHKVLQGDGLAQRIAIFTAVLATIGAVVSFLGGHTQNQALYYKNNAVLKKAEASDQWNFYQAKSQKESLAKIAASIITDPEKQASYKHDAERYAKEKEDIRLKAEGFEKESLEANKQSEEALHPHEKLAVSMTFLQIAIALASVAALTNKRWLLYGAGVAALIGGGLGVVAYLV
ncbi:MAG: DUF4337 domain-containing protein [Pseudomonadota bacterium]